jgi:hypothetical protein
MLVEQLPNMNSFKLQRDAGRGQPCVAVVVVAAAAAGGVVEGSKAYLASFYLRNGKERDTGCWHVH